MAIGPLPPVISEIQANSGQPGKTLGRTPSQTAPVDASAEVAPPSTVAILPETSLIEKAVADALGRQGSLAPLYATLTALAEADGLPDAIKAAISHVLAFQVGDGEATPERIAEAIRASGLFHEAVAAGKMSAALTPAIRQALGRSPALPSSPTAPVRAAASAAPSAGTSSPPLPPAPQPVTVERAMAAAIASYSRAAPVAPAPGATGQPAPASPLADVLSPDPGRAAASGGTQSTLPTPAAASATGSPTGAPQPAVPTTAQVPPSGAAPTGSMITVATASPTPVVATPLPTGSTTTPATPAPPLLSTGVPNSAGPPASVTAVPTPVSAPVASTPPASTPPSPVAAGSNPLAAAAPTSAASVQSGPLAAAPEHPAAEITARPAASTASSERTFTPWTLGRPMPAAQPAASTATSGTARPVAVPPSAATESLSPKPAGERAPFVPSSLETLPNPSPLRPAAVLTPQPGAAAPLPGTPAATSGPTTLQPAGQGTVPTSIVPPGTPSAAAPLPSIPMSGAQPAATGVLQPGATPSAGTLPQQPVTSAPTGTIDRPPGPGAALPVSGEIARPAAPVLPPLPTIAGLDLKGALDSLRRELIHWLGRSSDVMASLDGDDAPVLRTDRPAPPRRGGPVRGQPAVKLLDESGDAASTETLAGRALGETERSLARVFLHQAATADGRDSRPGQTTQALVMEIPLAGPNGTSVAQLRIERDDRAPTEPGAPPRRVFQVDIAFDIAPLGPVAVRIGLMDGRRVAVGVWCESDDGLVRMEQERSNIALGLEAEGMSVAGIDLHKGHPPEEREDAAAVARNHRLDLQL